MHEKHWIHIWSRVNIQWIMFPILLKNTQRWFYRGTRWKVCSLKVLFPIVIKYFTRENRWSIVWAIEAMNSRKREGKFLTGRNIQKAEETFKGEDISLGWWFLSLNKILGFNCHNQEWVFIFPKNGLQWLGKDNIYE